MKYLLVAQSMEKYSNLTEYCMPLGIAYINGAMRSRGFDVDALNMLFEDDPFNALSEKIKSQKIDALMCGGLTSEYALLKRIYELAREANPDIIVIGGGGGFTSEPILFSEMTGVDYAVIGEGEITNCELAQALENGTNVSQIPGIVYKTEDGYCQTPPRPFIKDVDSIPFPSYEGLSMDKYLDYQNVDGWYNYYTYYSDNPRLMPMLMARSCPFRCSFCFHPIGRGYRVRSLDNFFHELDLWIQTYQINGIALIDECFSIDPDRVIEFCRRIKPYKLSWACQMRAETYTDAVLKEMKESGCIGAVFGIESMSDRVLDNMNKHLNRQTIETALKLTYKYQLGCSGNLIFGAEAETFETMSESLSWLHTHAKKYGNYPCRQFAYVQTYPGSIYYENACRTGLIPDRRKFIQAGNWDLNITSLSQEDYSAIGDVIRLCRRENYNRGEVIDYTFPDDDHAIFTFRCSYCNSVNTYRNMNRKRFVEGKIKRLGCRHCNMLGDYILDTRKFFYDEYLAIPWFFDDVTINLDEEYFLQRRWKKIGFCGMNAFSKKMIGFLAGFKKVDVIFIYDYQIRPDFDCSVPQTSDPKFLALADVIINADLAYWTDMEKHIRSFYNGEIVYMETLLREFYNGCHD